MLSHVCSTREARIARLRQAIEETAALSGEEDLPELNRRLAALWAILADLDPVMAARLAGYSPEAE